MREEIRMDTPLTLKNGTIVKNRFLKSAMSEQLGDRLHNPGPGLAKLYGAWAEGGVGISVTGNVMIDRTALGEPANVVLDGKSDLAAFRRWAEAGTANGTQLWMQLNHPGKQTPRFLSAEPVAPSAIPLGAGLEKSFNRPRALSAEEVSQVVEKFALSARLAKEAGFTGVQIHGAHGYLVSQFLSPRHNARDDEWGGDAARRRRFVLAVYEGIRREVGADYPVSIKLNSADFKKGGFTEEESMAVVRALADAGIDLVEISGGTYESPSMTGHGVRESARGREAYFLAYAERVRALVDTPLAVTGGFRSGSAMAAALSEGALDMIGLARPMAVQPDMPGRLLRDPDHALRLTRPTTGVRWVDRMTMLDITWYEQQLSRISRDLEPSVTLGAWSSVFRTLSSMGGYAFRKRRA